MKELLEELKSIQALIVSCEYAENFTFSASRLSEKDIKKKIQALKKYI